MTYKTFTTQCKPGSKVTDQERIGTILKISQNNEKALVQFADGMKEWIEYYRIELL